MSYSSSITMIVVLIILSMVLFTTSHNQDSDKKLRIDISRFTTQLTKESICDKSNKKNTKITDYTGEIISAFESDKRTAMGKGGYMIYIKEDVILDCYKNRQNGECWGSFANSSRNIIDARPDLMKQNPNKCNARIVVHPNENKAYLIATCDILPEQEILVPYGKKYRFPGESHLQFKLYDHA